MNLIGVIKKHAFQAAKITIQTVMDVYPVQERPLELIVTLDDDYTNWSLWQMQQRKRVPLGFWSKKSPETRVQCTPFEQKLWAVYWALVDTEHLTVNHVVVIQPRISIMTSIMSNPIAHKIGHVQEPNIIKWKCYIQNKAKGGPVGILQLHKLIAN